MKFTIYCFAIFASINLAYSVPVLDYATVVSNYLHDGKIKVYNGGPTEIFVRLNASRFVNEAVNMDVEFCMYDETNYHVLKTTKITTNNFAGSFLNTTFGDVLVSIPENLNTGVFRVRYKYVDLDPSSSYYNEVRGPYYLSTGYQTFNASIVQVTTNPPVSNSMAIYRYYQSGPKANHFYTKSNEIPPGYSFEYIEFYALTVQKEGSVPIYRYYSPTAIDHFYVTVSNNSTFPDYNFESIEFYAYPSQKQGTVPVYRYFSPIKGDHFYTTHYSANGYVEGYYLEGIAFHAYEGNRLD